MTAYNEEARIGPAIESILNQTFGDFEFIIINDGSADQTATIIQSYHDPRIVYLDNGENLGIARSANRGLAVARGEFIARMDADDTSHPERFALQVAYLDAHPEVGVLGTYMVDKNLQGTPVYFFQPPLSHDLIAWVIMFETTTANPTVMMRRSLILKVGDYDPAFPPAEDIELWSRLIPLTRFANLPELLHYRLRHAQAASRTQAEKQLRGSIVARRRLIERLLQREVDPEIVGLATRPMSYVGVNPSASKLKAAIALMVEMYNAYRQTNSLTPEMVRAIGRDLIKRLFDLGHLYNHRRRRHYLLIYGTLLRHLPLFAMSPSGLGALCAALFSSYRLERMVRKLKERVG
jgi:glycosyltransferase involved in cell wall biosynthesis